MVPGAGRTRVVVIGAGIAGILTTIELRARGLTDVVVLEKGDAVGGTWRDNVYPGVGCDVPAHFYSFAFAPNPHWTHRFATGAQLWDYFAGVADSYGVTPHVRFGTEAVDATWHDGYWTVTTATGERLHAEIVVSCTGRLHHPRIPQIPGREDFAGTVVHSARWDPAIELDGRRLGVVGNGSSATQIVSATAGRVAHLDLFQRTAQWVLPMGNVPITWWRRLLLRIPAYFRRYHRWIEGEIDKIGRSAMGDPQARAERTRVCVDALNSVRDPELRAKLTPDHEVGCKRLVLSGTFHDAVQRENVDVVTEPIQRLEADGLRTTDGVLHPLDVLVLATGFHADAYLRPMTVTGEDGIGLDEVWDDLPVNYKSVAVPHMPNLFLINGPFSPGDSGSVLSVIEVHVGFVMQLVDRVVADGVALAPDPRRTAELLDAVRERAANSVWNTGGCTSWYLDDRGRPLVSQMLLADLRADMARPDFADFRATAQARRGSAVTAPRES